MSDLQGDIARVVVGARVDSLARVKANHANVRSLTVEVEFENGVPVEGRSWIERRTNMGKLLGVRG